MKNNFNSKHNHKNANPNNSKMKGYDFMKKTNKFAAFALAACMMAPMAMATTASFTASAATAGKVTITDEQGTSYGHKYDVYKIFNGTMNSGKLEGITFAGADFSTFLTDLKSDSTIGADFASCTTVVDTAKVLGGYDNNSVKAKAFAKFVATKKNLVKEESTANSNTISLADDGYYVIIEQDTSGTPESVALTSYLLTTYDASEGQDIKAKSAIPSLEKKIQENVKTGTWQNDDTYGERYNDTADFSIGDTVPFKLYGTMPSNIADYPSYKYVFHDKLGSEFTPNDDVKVYAVNGTDRKEISSASYSKTASSGDTITVSFENLKSAVDAEDNAITLNASTKIIVEYTAILNDKAQIGKPGQTNAAYLEYSNNPNVGGSGKTSKTPEDKVIAFTYELDVTKLDGATKDKLEGAKFKLKAVDGAHLGKWASVSNGKISGWVDNEADATELVSGANGVFSVIGLDDGKYSLTETLAPSGYNTLTSAIEFIISAETSNSQNDNTIDGEELTKLEIKVGESENPVAGDLDSGAVSMEVENNSGSTLPSTGGIGTTIFYVLGGTLVVGSGIALVTKKRLGKNED
ncbi:MAG: isopeptide-forming domain-containing fimbrial protein [Ruminococcus sp.]|nr:isopeptide-forming domain-containing fimbrial protein [Ruminococcus sp.]